MSAAILLRGCNAYIRHLTISHNTPCLTPQKYAEPRFLLSPALGHHSLPKINWGQYLSIFFGGEGGGGGKQVVFWEMCKWHIFKPFLIHHFGVPKNEAFLMEMSFICIGMKNHFDIKRWALHLVLMQRPRKTRKWPTHVLEILVDTWTYINTCRLWGRGRRDSGRNGSGRPGKQAAFWKDQHKFWVW